MFNFELAGLSKAAKGFNPVKVEKEFDRQLTDSTRKARTLISKQVRARYNVKAGLLGGGKLSRVKIKKVRHKRVLVYKSHMIGLDKMSAKKVIATKKPRRYGVNVTVTKGNRTRVKGGFLGKSKNRRHTFVYARVGRGAKTKTGKDKLERKYTISVAHMVGQTPVAKNGKQIVDHFAAGFEKRLKKLR